MSARRPVEAIGTAEPVEAIARTLVLLHFPALEAALMSGAVYRRTVEAIIAEASPGWTAEHGSAVAIRAAEILRRLGPATILTPYGRALYLRDTPPVTIPGRTPPEANDNAPARRRSWPQRLWAWLWVGVSRA